MSEKKNEKSKRGGGKLKDTSIPILTDDAEIDVVKETSEDNEIEITKTISSNKTDKKKKKKRDISTSEILNDDIDDKSSTSSNDSNPQIKKKFRADDTVLNAFANLFGSDESDNEDPRTTQYRKLLKISERNKAIKLAPKTKQMILGHFHGRKVTDPPSIRKTDSGYNTGDDVDSEEEKFANYTIKHQSAPPVLRTNSISKYMLRNLEIDSINAYEKNRRNLISDGVVSDPHQQIDDSTLSAIGLALKFRIDTQKHILHEYIRENEADVIELLKKIATRSKSNSDTTLTDAIKMACAKFILDDYNRGSVLTNTINLLEYIKKISADGMESLSVTQHAEIFNFWKQNLFIGQGSKMHNISDKLRLKLQNIIFPTGGEASDRTIVTLLSHLENTWDQYQEIRAKAAEWGLISPEEKARSIASQQPASKGSNSSKTSDTIKAHSSRDETHTPKPRCSGCGNDPEKQKPDKKCTIGKSCAFWKHPDCNKDKTISFLKSDKGKLYIKAKPFKMSWIQPNKKIGKDGKMIEYKEVTRHDNSLNTLKTETNSYPRPTVICRTNDGTEFTALIDSGSVGFSLANYMDSSLAKLFKESNGQHCKCEPATTCTTVGCFETKTCITLELTLATTEEQLTNVKLDFRLVEGLNEDCIIGYESVVKLDLTKVFRHLFKTNDNELSDTIIHKLPYSTITSRHSERNEPQARTAENSLCAICPNKNDEDSLSTQLLQLPHKRTTAGDGRSQACKCKLSTRRVVFPNGGSHSDYRVDPSNAVMKHTVPESLSDHSKSSSSMTTAYLSALNERALINKESLLDIEDDDDQIDEFQKESLFDSWINEPESIRMDNEIHQTKLDVEDDILSRIRIFYPPEFEKERNEITQIILKLKTLFSKELPTTPASIAPFELSLVPDADWTGNNRNKQRARLQSSVKQHAVQKFIHKAMACNLIRPSQADAWSQVLLTPKPDGSWRFCVDFRTLNSMTKSMGWPIPNIAQLLQRIGEKKAVWFAVLDLTMGYHNAPIDERSIPLTAFLCSEGLFEWLRLPMGLKSAGSYFQHHMTNTILKELIEKICEAYLDDIIAFANTPRELNTRLELIFKRLKLYGVTLNPDKVRIGMQEVEYVGHLIDKDGLSFSEEKKKAVLDFRRPTSANQMKSLLGLTSQFREHVQDYGTISAPLHAMIPNYKKNSQVVLKWTDELDQCFKTLIERVSNCQKLYFLDDTSPISLHTDASNYGIGAYLFQEVDGKRVPISFISRTLNKTELKWSTIEKEAYSIFFAFQKLEHLIRYRPFTLRTDSKNLTFINVDHREKVKRWKLAIQHFDFKVFHIAGKDNIEADGFSRLVHFPEKTENQLNALRQSRDKKRKKYEHMQPEIYAKIQKAHGSKIGHGGVQRTLDVLKRIGTEWKGMRKHVTQFVRQCPCCQKMSTIKPLVHTKPFTLATYNPMERICIDAIGPINEEGQDEFSNYILVIIDAFSRFCRLYAIHSVTAENALGPLKDWICTFGCPSEIVSDNGTQFANELIRAFLENSNIEHALIHAYSSEENALVERANKEVNRHVSSMAYDELIRAVWRENLPYVQRIMNTQVHTSIGVSPSQLIFGNAINHDTHFLTEPKTDSTVRTYHKKIEQLYTSQERLLRVAQKTQEDLDNFHIAQRDSGKETHFPVNSYVLASYETRKSSKFQTNRHGPYRVISHNGPIYTLENLVTHKYTDFHVKLLHEFDYDDSKTDPYEVARHDKEYDDIQQILEHRFTNTRKARTDLEFKIIWARSSTPVWEKWNATLGANETVHEYLRNNQLRRMIPPKYTWPKDHPDYTPPDRRARVEAVLPVQQAPKKRKRRKMGRY